MDGELLQRAETQMLPRPPAKAVPEGVTTVCIGAIVLGLTLLVYWWRRRTLDRIGVRSAAMDERAIRTAPPAAIAETHALAKDLNELGERIAAELDARAGRLENLIAVAEARISDLEKLQSRTVEVKAAPASSQSDPQFGEIYELADRGLSPLDIARHTQRPTGQVELILNLRRGAVAL